MGKAGKISLIVLHATVSDFRSTIEWFKKRESKVSAHYVISKRGRLVQMVAEGKRAWHAGVSRWKGRPNVNNFSMGIELENRNETSDSYTSSQYRILAELVRQLLAKYRLKWEAVVGHCHVAPRRKTDPGKHFDWERLKRLVSSQRQCKIKK